MNTILVALFVLVAVAAGAPTDHPDAVTAPTDHPDVVTAPTDHPDVVTAPSDHPVAALAQSASIDHPVAVAASARSAPIDHPVAILSQEQDISPDGSFSSKFETENGISEQIQGSVKQIDPKTQIQVIQGTVSYTAPDGTPVKFTWVADENGYQPKGDLLPTPPAIPADIQRGLEYSAAHPQPTELPAQQQLI